MSRQLPSAPRSGSLGAPGQVYMSQQVIDLIVSGDLELEQITLKIMETPLEGLLQGVLARFNCATGHGFVAMHDYILVEYAPGKWIKAEKGGESRREGAKAGIHLSLVDRQTSNMDQFATNRQSVWAQGSRSGLWQSCCR